ncbi:hypothetical protein Tco_0291533 [Tanacetum coccineum]
MLVLFQNSRTLSIPQEVRRTSGKLWEHTMMRPDHHDPNALDNMKPWKRYCFHKFTMSSCYGKDVTEMLSLVLLLYHADELKEDGFNVYFEGEWLRIYCRDLDMTPLRDLIDSVGKLIPEDPQLGVPRVGIPRPPRASMQDLYDRMGRMEICQEAIEGMEYMQSYH